MAGLASQADPKLSEYLQTTLFLLGWWCNDHAPDVWKSIRFSLLVGVNGKFVGSRQVSNKYVSHKSCCLSQLVVQWFFIVYVQMSRKFEVQLQFEVVVLAFGQAYPTVAEHLANLALRLGWRCKHTPSQGRGSGGWVCDYSEQSLWLSSQCSGGGCSGQTEEEINGARYVLHWPRH